MPVTLFQIGFPSKNEGPHSLFSAMDYEDDAEFLISFNRKLVLSSFCSQISSIHGFIV